MEENKEIIPTAKELQMPVATLQAVTGLFNTEWQELPNPDLVLRKAGKNTVTEYRKLLYDPHVWAVVQSRFSGLNKLEWRVNSVKGSAKIRKSVEKFLMQFDFQQLFWNATKTALFGYSVTELIWSKSEDVWSCKLNFLPADWFYCDEQLRWRMRKYDDTTGMLLPVHKFIVLQHEASYTNPYGFAVLSATYWAVAFKRVGIEQWTRFGSEYGLPFLLGKAPAGSDKRFVDAMLDSMAAMRTGGALVLDERANVEALNVGNSQAGTMFASIIDYANAEISKAILSETLTTEMGNTGSYAAANVHKDVRRSVTDTDVKLAKTFVDSLIESFVVLNFGTGVPIPEIELFENDDVQAERSERDGKLFALGVRFTPEYFSEYYGLKDGEFIVSGLDVGTSETPEPVTPEPETETETTEEVEDVADDVENDTQTDDDSVEMSEGMANAIATLMFNKAKDKRIKMANDGNASVDNGVSVAVNFASEIVDAFIGNALAEIESAKDLKEAEKKLAKLLRKDDALQNVFALAMVAGRGIGQNNV
jgi:phage gp29-like protein